jgi:hypothetical protein
MKGISQCTKSDCIQKYVVAMIGKCCFENDLLSSHQKRIQIAEPQYRLPA